MESEPLVPTSEASNFLLSLVNKNLRVTTTDSRMFWGSFKCTDSVSHSLPPDLTRYLCLRVGTNTYGQESNIVLKHTYEYRKPAPPKPEELAAGGRSIKQDMTSRFLGLVVVPGRHIVKIEVEEFASQMKIPIIPPNEFLTPAMERGSSESSPEDQDSESNSPSQGVV